jgi:hypothetical protein
MAPILRRPFRKDVANQRAFLEGYGRDVLPRVRRTAGQREADHGQRKCRSQEQRTRQLAGATAPSFMRTRDTTSDSQPTASLVSTAAVHGASGAQQAAGTDRTIEAN